MRTVPRRRKQELLAILRLHVILGCSWGLYLAVRLKDLLLNFQVLLADFNSFMIILVSPIISIVSKAFADTCRGQMLFLPS